MIETQLESFNFLFCVALAALGTIVLLSLSLFTLSLFVVSEFMSQLSLASRFPLSHLNLENCGNAGIPILFSCLWVVVGWGMWHVVGLLCQTVSLSVRNYMYRVY